MDTPNINKILSFSTNIAKVENKGEDADPLLYVAQDGNSGYLGVFDGLGGAGSIQYEDGQEKRTGAYIASRTVAGSCKEYFDFLLSNNEVPGNVMINFTSDNLKDLKQKIISDLKQKLLSLKYEPTKIKSSLIRTLPTTLSCMYWTREKENGVIVKSIWAGDSRNYFLSSDEGLIQLTKDDLKKENDPYENLQNDSPLSNFIQIDVDFSIALKKVSDDNKPINKPIIMFCASDGCFGYFNTPMHFEYFLLRTLFNSTNMEEWQMLIEVDLKEIAGDDFSIALLVLGWYNIEDIKRAFTDRKNYINNSYIEELNTLEELLKEAAERKEIANKQFIETEKQYRDIQLDYWNKYKENYLISKT